MAITTKGSYYADEPPEVPVPPGYTAPTPHDANISHRPFEAPSGDNAPSEGFSATDNPQLTRPGGVSTEGQNQANAAFDAMGTAP